MTSAPRFICSTGAGGNATQQRAFLAPQQPRTIGQDNRHALQIFCARKTSKQRRLKAAVQHPVPPEVSAPAAKSSVPITTTILWVSPAGAANELRELGKTLQNCDVYVKRDQANGRRVKDLLNTIMGRTAQPTRTISCAVTEDGLHALGPQGVTDALRGMAYIGERFAFVQEMSAILQGVEFEAAWGGQHFAPEQLTDCAVALARAAHWTPKLDGLGARLKVFGGLSSRSPRQLQQLLWSLAVLNHAPVSLLNPNRPLQLQRVKESVVRRLDTKGLSIACWSLCVVGKHTSGWFSQLWDELVARWADGRLQLTVLNCGQIYQVVRTLQLEGAPDLQWTPAAQDLADKALRLQAAYLQENRASFTRSVLHEDVVRTIIGMGVEYECEDISTGYAVDISIPELKIAVEVDGPAHFSRDSSCRPLGSTAFKRRHLEAMGWAPFSVTPHDFDSPARHAVRLQDLRDLIKERRAKLLYD